MTIEDKIIQFVKYGPDYLMLVCPFYNPVSVLCASQS